jgi:hypothetical protein
MLTTASFRQVCDHKETTTAPSSRAWSAGAVDLAGSIVIVRTWS